jgi:hypothetical protein
MESIIDTSSNSQRVRPQPSEKLVRLVVQKQNVGLGKRGIISSMAFEGQVSRFVVGLMFLGLFASCRPNTPPKMAATRVTGASMSPTIWGESIEVLCPACTIHWRVNWQVAMRPQRPFPCWNCGHTIDHAHFTDLEYSKNRSSDHVIIDGDAYRHASPQVDQIVAIGNSQAVRIKRIVAVAGDVVSSQDGVLYRNDRPVVSDAPWIAVHDDRHRDRDKSWWAFDETTSAQVAEKTFNGFRIEMTPSDEDFPSRSPLPAVRLLYQHRSPYNGLRPERVGDDYPGNLNETRPLHPVDSLGLRVTFDVDQATELRCWLWKSTGPRFETHRLSLGTHALQVRWHDTESTKSELMRAETGTAPLSLGKLQPICIEVLKGALHIRHLQVERPIQYTIDTRRSDAIKLPVLLQADQYFVVGDNVPVSIDSRYEGPIDRSDIMGRVSTHKVQR